MLPQGVLGEQEVGGQQAAGVSGKEPLGLSRGTPRPNVDSLTESFNWPACLKERQSLITIYDATLELDRCGGGRLRVRGEEELSALTALRLRAYINRVIWGGQHSIFGLWPTVTTHLTRQLWNFNEMIYIKSTLCEGEFYIILSGPLLSTQTFSGDRLVSGPRHSLITRFSTPPFEESLWDLREVVTLKS